MRQRRAPAEATDNSCRQCQRRGHEGIAQCELKKGFHSGSFQRRFPLGLVRRRRWSMTARSSSNCSGVNGVDRTNWSSTSATGGFHISGVAGQSAAATLATFVDSGGPQNPNDPGDYHATIDWGDTTTSSGTITLAGTVFTVAGSHTYAEAGTFTVSVTVVHESAPPVTVTDTATVSGGPMVGSNGNASNGNVTVSLTQLLGLLRIIGLNDNVVINIQQSSPGVLEVAGIGTLINQSSEPVDFPLNSVSEIDVTLLNGNDTVTMNNVNIPGNISFIAGSGSDSVSLSSIDANLISLQVAGPGPDTVLLEHSRAAAVSITAGDNASLSLNDVSSAGLVTLTAGKNATVGVNNLTAAGDLDITVGDNAQAVRLEGSSSNNLNLLQTGTNGSPLFDLENDSIDENFNFNAGDGNNTITLSGVRVGIELLMRLGAGMNTLSADHVTAVFGSIDGGPGKNNTYIDGGGNSGLFVQDFVGARLCLGVTAGPDSSARRDGMRRAGHYLDPPACQIASLAQCCVLPQSNLEKRSVWVSIT
jgi:hypothetical protein